MHTTIARTFVVGESPSLVEIKTASEAEGFAGTRGLAEAAAPSDSALNHIGRPMQAHIHYAA